MSEQALLQFDFEKKETPEYSVSEVALSIKNIVERNFSHMKIRGEISGLRPSPSGHLYFSLKDDKAVLASVCWRGVSAKIDCRIEDGLEIIATGFLTTFASQSKYQFVVEDIKLAGIGALMDLFNKKKAQFEAEGLFLAQYKKNIPTFARRIGIITSPTGSVIRDMLHRIGERMPMPVIVWPTLVQGERAHLQISEGIVELNQLTGSMRPDVIIIARGGGSFEDLWCFNDELVVRTAFASDIPIISAIGHETDFTLLDFVADLRAPTPTAAAEIATIVRLDMLNRIASLNIRLKNVTINMMKNYHNQLQILRLTTPIQFIENWNVALDNLSMLLNNRVKNMLVASDSRYELVSSHLSIRPYVEKIKLLQLNICRLGESLEKNFHSSLIYRAEQLQHLSSLIMSYHYKNVLMRGFSVLKTVKNETVTSVKNVKIGEKYQLELQDGVLQIVAEQMEEH